MFMDLEWDEAEKSNRAKGIRSTDKQCMGLPSHTVGLSYAAAI